MSCSTCRCLFLQACILSFIKRVNCVMCLTAHLKMPTLLGNCWATGSEAGDGGPLAPPPRSRLRRVAARAGELEGGCGASGGGRRHPHVEHAGLHDASVAADPGLSYKVETFHDSLSGGQVSFVCSGARNGAVGRGRPSLQLARPWRSAASLRSRSRGEPRPRKRGRRCCGRGRHGRRRA